MLERAKKSKNGEKVPLIRCLHHSLHPKFVDPTMALCVAEMVDLVFLLMNLLSMVLLKH